VQTTRRHRTIGASTQELWEVVRDPHHLPRWWPRVARVEAVRDDAFTEVLRTDKGKSVRADFTLLALDETQRRLAWAQQLKDSPFARLLSAAETEVRLTPAGEATNVELELRQQLTGIFPRLGSYLVRRAAAATLEEALDGLERISVAHPGAHDA
jgi:carbon monoxide dehydrogenase subunit G